MFVESLFGRAMRSLIAIERNLMRQSTLAPESPPEESLGGGDVPFGAQQEIDGLSLFVDRTVEIGPASFDFHVGFVDAPGSSRRASEAAPALFEFRDIALDPTHDRRVRQGEPAFGHHLDEITKAEFVAQIPAHTEDDDLPVEMAAFEKFVHAQHASQLHRELRSREICPASDLCTITILATSNPAASQKRSLKSA